MLPHPLSPSTRLRFREVTERPAHVVTETNNDSNNAETSDDSINIETNTETDTETDNSSTSASQT